MFNVRVSNVTGTRRDEFTADSLKAAKRRASELLHNKVVPYSYATITEQGVATVYTGAVSVGGNRINWTKVKV